MAVLEDHMVVDAGLRAEIVARVLAGNFGDQPDRAVHELGRIDLPQGRVVPLYLRHAADAVLIDDCGQTVLITRGHNPGRGKLALPGGFLDAGDDGVETSLDAAMREAVEETGIGATVLRKAAMSPLGPRRYDRPFDIRAAWSDLAGTAIRKGDFFAVSTRGFRFHVAGDLREFPLKAGDDAHAVHVVRLDRLTPAQFAVPDHLEMIRAAEALP
jgi:ADP-ribose pyrophosphatase YjhB (NUDIX family)